jgi:hypothetical protein
MLSWKPRDQTDVPETYDSSGTLNVHTEREISRYLAEFPLNKLLKKLTDNFLPIYAQ